LQKIAAWVLDNTSDVPIWISLADLQGKSLEQYLLCDWLKAATRKVRVTEAMQEALGELFNSGRVWLLLDAADEMGIASSENALAQIAKQLTGWVGDATVLLTCRPQCLGCRENALEAFDTYRNLDFSYGDAQTPDQVGQFIRRWFKGSPARGERLRAELDQPGRERIKDAVKNPLRLALLCRAWSLGQGELPNTKAGLYQQFTDALYEWKQDRFPTSSSQRQELNKALGELALRAIASEKTKFRLRHRLVCSVLGKP
jgi:predicted NACHT family NTPase